MRYKFYKEHKYVSFKFDELERLVARADFRQEQEFNKVKEEFEKLVELLIAHAQYEDNSLHVLLKRKNSAVYKHNDPNAAKLLCKKTKYHCIEFKLRISL